MLSFNRGNVYRPSDTRKNLCTNTHRQRQFISIYLGKIFVCWYEFILARFQYCASGANENEQSPHIYKQKHTQIHSIVRKDVHIGTVLFFFHRFKMENYNCLQYGGHIWSVWIFETKNQTYLRDREEMNYMHEETPTRAEIRCVHVRANVWKRNSNWWLLFITKNYGGWGDTTRHILFIWLSMWKLLDTF